MLCMLLLFVCLSNMKVKREDIFGFVSIKNGSIIWKIWVEGFSVCCINVDINFVFFCSCFII